MPVKIRLRRMGAKGQPSYRIVVANSTTPRDGRYLDQIGFYNPLKNPAIITVNRAKAIKWLQNGAQPTETVEILLKKFGITPEAARKGEITGEEPVEGAAPPEETQSVQADEIPVGENGE